MGSVSHSPADCPVERVTVFLMYHELELPGRAMCQAQPGYTRYVLKSSDFRTQIKSLQEMKWRGLSVSEALTFSNSRSVAITFDDGCETDLLYAAPTLKEAGFGATFYITAGFLGKPGYLSRAQVRELADSGFEIGCHSMTHPYLSDLDVAELHSEITVPKRVLEDILGRPVQHFSCPGGRWNPRVVEVAREAGYESLATSHSSANSADTDSFSLGRVAVMRDTDRKAFERICRAQGLWRLQLRDFARSRGKLILGNAAYDALRTVLLSRKDS
jgi:peptidoglycan/xylan/chitin deacetylase (PgdA/CDA1 family)